MSSTPPDALDELDQLWVQDKLREELRKELDNAMVRYYELNSRATRVREEIRQSGHLTSNDDHDKMFCTQTEVYLEWAARYYISNWGWYEDLKQRNAGVDQNQVKCVHWAVENLEEQLHRVEVMFRVKEAESSSAT
jgi:hypothetical protein